VASPSARRTVVLGCSFAALEFLYRACRRRGRFGPGEITVVEPLASHPYIPLVHEMVSGARPVSALEFDTARFCRGIGATLVHQAAESLDPTGRTVRLADGTELPYDRLILTVGSVPDLPLGLGAADDVYAAKFLHDAVRLRARLLALATENADPVRVVVVGAGITGTEWSAELAGRGVSGARLAVTLIGREPRILPELPDNVARHAARRLDRLGVRVLLGHKTVAARRGAVTVVGETGNGADVVCDIVVWAAGVRPSPFVGRLGLPVTAEGKLVVTPRLDVPGHPEIFAAGDAARIVENGHEWPTAVRAIEAIWQGAYLGRHLVADMARGTRPRYRFRETFFYGVSLGPRHSLIVYDRWWLDGKIFVAFRRWLQWAYYARFRILARLRGVASASQDTRGTTDDAPGS
jgi:NADH dehydrogenase